MGWRWDNPLPPVNIQFSVHNVSATCSYLDGVFELLKHKVLPVFQRVEDGVWERGAEMV